MKYLSRYLFATITAGLCIGCSAASDDEARVAEAPVAEAEVEEALVEKPSADEPRVNEADAEETPAEKAPADEGPVLARIDEQLAELKTYRYEGSGDSVLKMERTIFQLPVDSPLRAKIEQKLIDALNDSNDIGRGVICRQLRVIGTDQCIPAMAPLLNDPELAHFARYALQGIGSDAALGAMYEALGKTSGTVQVSLINALADRDYEPLRADCVRLLDSNDPQAAAAAIRALGRFGGVETADVLVAAKQKVAEQLAANVDAALVDCAEQLVLAGERDKAAEVLGMLYEQGGPSRLAALRGLAAADPDQAVALLVQAIRSEDRRLVMSAIHLTPQVSADHATEQFVAVLDELPIEPQGLLLKALGERGDPSAVPAVIEAVNSDNSHIRLAAVEALGGLSGTDAIDALIEIAAGGDEAATRSARNSLARITGADARLAAVAQDSHEELAVEAIRALASRKAPEQTELILQLARDDSQPRRAAAIDALGSLASADDVNSLVQLVLDEEMADDLSGIERSLGSVLLRIDSPADRARPILAALSGASTRARPVLIRQLAHSGTGDALEAVRAALQSADLPTSDAAVAALANWPNITAGDDLIKLIETARTDELGTTALSGYLRIASLSDDPTAMFLDALRQVSGVGNKKRVLNELGLNSESFDAVAAAQSLLQDPQLGSTAAVAAIRIAYKLRLNHKDEARKILNNVLATVDHPDVQKRAQDVLNDLDKYEDHILQWVAVGPFVDEDIISGEQNYRTVFEPEKANPSVDLKWEPIELGIGSWNINLEATYGPIDHCAAYLRTMVWSPIDQDVQIEGGCDDALKIWVNDALVYDQYNGGASPRSTLARAKLQQGWNELKLKAVDHEGGWAFGCRVRRPNGAKLDGLKYEAR